MSWLRQNLVTLLAALAVLVVGTTCTQAGCLLTLKSEAAAKVRQSCCASHEKSPTQSDGEKKCPLCHQAALLAKGADQQASDTHALDVAPLLAPIVVANVSVTPRTTLSIDSPFLPAPLSTLLALHCALLT